MTADGAGSAGAPRRERGAGSEGMSPRGSARETGAPPCEPARETAASPRDPGLPALTGLVLAGGGSTRMGRDKALLEVGGRRLVDRVGAALEAVCAEVLVASGDGRRLAGLPWPQVADAQPDAGPLAGILAGLRGATTPLVAVVAVDMPRASPPLLLHLAALWAGEPAVVPVAAGRPQPLHAVWAADAAGRVAALLAAGERSPTRAVAALGARLAGPSELPEAERDGRFAVNINRPADLRRV